MIGVLIFAIIALIVGYIYRGIWNKTREKLEREDEKFEFLKSKFSYLHKVEFDNKIEDKDIKIAECVRILNKHGIKKGKIDNVIVSMPHKSKTPWKVFLTVKYGMWPLDNEKEIEIHTISDSDLNKLLA